ncbi:MAG: hypothetical protein ACK5P6_01745 [Pseudobdellovibrionaceae bacterium]
MKQENNLQTGTLVKILCIGVVLLFYRASFAQSRAGLVLGDPTGFSFQQETSKTRALEGVLGWSASDLTLIGNYLFVEPQRFRMDSAQFDLYYGVGLRLISIDGGKNDGELSISPRAPLGTRYRFQGSRLEAFGELSLNMELTPETGFDIDGGLGLRYRF